MIEKKIYYVWVGNGKKPDIFYRCYESWKKYLPNYEIIEINEKNFDIKTHMKKNRFLKECYDRKLWAYVSDYIRAYYMYEHSGVYLDIDLEIIKDITPLLSKDILSNEIKPSFFIGYEDNKNVSVGIFGTEKNHKFLKDVMNFYEEDVWKLPIWTVPKIFTYILEKNYNLTEKKENILKGDNIVIYPKEFFYPYHFTEKYTDECITENTYGIHWWNDSWSSLKAKLFLETKHLKGVKKLVKYIKVTLRHYIKKY